MDSTIVWGHRGAGFRDVENSMSSFKKAVDMGVDGIKTEAQLTNDGEILLHFLPFIVLKNNKSFIQDIGIKTAKKVKLGNGESIPTLRDMFEEFGDKIRYNFDIFRVETGLKIIEIAESYKLINKVEITKPVGHTKSADSLFKPLRERCKEVKLVCSLYSDIQISENNYRHLDHMKELEVQVINLAHHRFNLEVFYQVKKAGFKFYLWSVLFKYFMRKYLNLNYKGYSIDGIYTNYPDKLVELRSEIKV
ncbi:MAG: glycerophosphodiester phosphodiesterase [Candidatus Hodarchaeales archaeon]|jgi:glycerophosphoryl diester phosphodiesterase